MNKKEISSQLVNRAMMSLTSWAKRITMIMINHRALSESWLIVSEEEDWEQSHWISSTSSLTQKSSLFFSSSHSHKSKEQKLINRIFPPIVGEYRINLECLLLKEKEKLTICWVILNPDKTPIRLFRRLACYSCYANKRYI
jgi:hypothetical protein